MTDQGQTQPKPPHDGAHIWWRILPMLFFAVAADLTLWLLCLGALLQYLFKGFTGSFNAQVTSFNRRIRLYLVEVFDYLTMVHDNMPFPFNDFPGDDGKGEPVEPTPPHAPQPAAKEASKPAAEEAPKPAAKPAAAKPAARKPATRKPATRKSSPASKTSGTAKPAAKPRRRAAPKKPPAENSES